MTQEQLLEKQLFKDMVDAITRFKLLKEATQPVTNTDRSFVHEKIDTLSEVVKNQIELEMNLENAAAGVNPADFTRVHVVDPLAIPLPSLDSDSDSIGDTFPRLQPRK